MQPHWIIQCVEGCAFVLWATDEELRDIAPSDKTVGVKREVAKSPVAPDGWKLVPIYATADMSHAGHEYYQKSKKECGDFTPIGMYNAMLNASPDYIKGS